MRALFLFFWGGLCLTVAAERFNLEHAAQIASLSNPQITPDGRTVVVAVTRADRKQNRFTTELVRIDTASRSRKVLLNRPAGQHRLSPRQATGVRRDRRRQVPDLRSAAGRRRAGASITRDHGSGKLSLAA